jgi:hypothetical protein
MALSSKTEKWKSGRMEGRKTGKANGWKPGRDRLQ